MFTEFIENGSLIAVICMAYMNTVYYEILNAKQASFGLNTPQIIVHPVSKIIQLLAFPCLFWPAIYVGLFSGWLAGVISWVIIMAGGGALSIPLKIKSEIGLHFVPASVCMVIGYYLSITNLPS